MPAPPITSDRSARGFTLIEIIVALAIAGGVLVTVLIAVNGLMGNPAKTEVMRFAGAIRYAYGEAAIRSHRYDIVMDLDAGSYSLACSEDNVLVIRELPGQSASQRAFGRNRDRGDAFAQQDPNEQRALRRTRDGTAGDPRSIAAERQPDHISGCDSAMIQTVAFERGVRIVRVRTSRSPDAIEDGTARIAIFPDGTMERAIIWLETEQGRKFTLLTDEMTGRIEIVAGDIDRVEDFFRVEAAR